MLSFQVGMLSMYGERTLLGDLCRAFTPGPPPNWSYHHSRRLGTCRSCHSAIALVKHPVSVSHTLTHYVSVATCTASFSSLWNSLTHSGYKHTSCASYLSKLSRII